MFLGDDIGYQIQGDLNTDIIKELLCGLNKLENLPKLTDYLNIFENILTVKNIHFSMLSISAFKDFENIGSFQTNDEKAINETPYLREPLVEMGMLEYGEKNYKDAIIYLEKALNIEEKYKNYINEPFCLNFSIYDILSVCKYYTNDYKDSLYYVTKALKLDNDNERLIINKKLIEDKV